MFAKKTIPALATAALALSATMLTGCQAANPGTVQETKSVNSTAEKSENSMSGIMLHDGWAKAGSGMTAAFGTLMNHTDKDVKLTGAESSVAKMVELHETDKTTGKMSPVKDGLKIPAGGSLELAPGGYHIMLMEMTGELKAGDELPLTLDFSDGSKVKVKVLVKDYSGAQENYGEDSADHSTMHEGMSESSDSATAEHSTN